MYVDWSMQKTIAWFAGMGEYRLFAFCPAIFFGPTLSDTFSAQGTRLYDSSLEPQPVPP